jgi:hypothetical protein
VQVDVRRPGVSGEPSGRAVGLSDVSEREMYPQDADQQLLAASRNWPRVTPDQGLDVVSEEGLAH